SPEDAGVVHGLVSALPDHALEMPTRLVGETREFLRRDEEEIEPISDAVLVPDPEREESGRSPAAHVPLHVGQVVLRPSAGNPAVSDQAPALSGDASKLAEEPPKVGHVARKAEAVAQHEDGVEGPQPPRP